MSFWKWYVAGSFVGAVLEDGARKAAEQAQREYGPQPEEVTLYVGDKVTYLMQIGGYVVRVPATIAKIEPNRKKVKIEYLHKGKPEQAWVTPGELRAVR